MTNQFSIFSTTQEVDLKNGINAIIDGIKRQKAFFSLKLRLLVNKIAAAAHFW